MKKILFVIMIFMSCLCFSQEIDTSIFNAYKQSNIAEGGNCVSIALIKACFSKYGFKNVFNSVEKKDTIYNVVLRNNIKLSITDNQLLLAKERAGFVLKDSTDFSIKFKEFSEFCFAVMCMKNKIDKKIDTYEKAITNLNSGYKTKLAYKLLGVNFKKVKSKTARTNKLKHLVVYNTYHAVYASDGYYDESWNKETGINKLSNLKWKRFGYKCFWKLCTYKAYEIVD